MFQSIVDDSDNKNTIVRTSLPSNSIEHMKTPEEVIRQIEVLKNVEKLKYFESMQHSVIMKSNLSHLVHASVNRLFDTSCYKLLQNEDIQAMLTEGNIDKVETELIVTRHCPKFVETVVIINGFWLLCTSFCAFIHKNELDDCADKSRIGFQTKPVSFIRRKTRAGSDYFELTIRIGMIELLVTSGFFGSINDSTVEAFFGSSIPNLPLSISSDYNTAFTESLFIPAPAKQYIRRARLLNQYMKAHSSYDWMFISAGFYNKGYAPHHPLQFERDNCLQEAASLLLKVVTYNVLYNKEIAAVKLNISRQRKKKDTDAAKLIVKYITDLSCCDELHLEKYDKSKLKADMLQIYESILAGAIKRNNKTLAKKVTSKYTASSSILFDE